MGSLAASSEPAAEEKPPADSDDQRADDEGGRDDGVDPPRPSRREEATRRAVADEMAKLQEKLDQRLTQSQQQYQQELSRVQQENARLAGQLEAWQRQPQQSATPAVREDPAELKRQARAALDAGKFDDYERLTERAGDVRDAARWEERERRLTQQFHQALPQQVPPMIAALIGKHEHVAMAGPRGEAIVTNKAQALELAGWQRGPALLSKAFELANEELKASAASQAAALPRFDTSTAAALGGVPGSSQPAAGGGGEGSGAPAAGKLTPTEESVRKTMKMTVEEYQQWKTDPEKAARAARKKRA